MPVFLHCSRSDSVVATDRPVLLCLFYLRRPAVPVARFLPVVSLYCSVHRRAFHLILRLPVDQICCPGFVRYPVLPDGRPEIFLLQIFRLPGQKPAGLPVFCFYRPGSFPDLCPVPDPRRFAVIVVLRVFSLPVPGCRGCLHCRDPV